MICVLDMTLPSPAENLALDEALLEACDAGEGPEVLRFWEPTSVFAVVGYANVAEREVNLAACDKEAVPVLRRCSGGGTVLQMPGVLNYNLVLRIPESGPMSTVPGTNRWVMNRVCDALARLPGLIGRLSVRGTTDLCLGERKVMGNAQRRKRAALIFHGSLLLKAELEWISRLLPMPSQQPDYRAKRSHGEFCANLPIRAEEVKRVLGEEWNATEPLHPLPLKRLASLMDLRYGRTEWHRKF